MEPLFSYKRNMLGRLLKVYPTGETFYPAEDSQEVLDFLAQGGVIGWVDSLEARQSYIKELIKNKCNEVIRHSFEMDGKWFSSTLENGLELAALCLYVLFDRPIPPGQPWRCISGETPELTPELIENILVATVEHGMACYAVRDYHVAQMLASSEPVYYDFSTGWPANYTGVPAV